MDKKEMKVWLVNSNSNEDNGNPNGFRYMLHQSRVATFYDKVSEVNNIKRGDLILLYHNANRVIAVGFALDLQEHDFSDIQNIERWVDVNWIWKANFNENEYWIDRHKLKFTQVRPSVNNITDEINLFALLQEIGRKQTYSF